MEPRAWRVASHSQSMSVLQLLVLKSACALGLRDGWSVLKNADAIHCTTDCHGSPGHFTQHVAPSVDACRSSCAKQPNCTIFAFNQKSNDCFWRTDKTWQIKASDHVVSGCLPTAVPGCPPAPSPPPPRAPKHRAINVSNYATKNTLGLEIVGNRILFAGGHVHGPNTSILYDANQGIFTKNIVGNISANRSFGAGITAPGGFYTLVAGGQSGSKKFANVDTFDAIYNAWSVLPSLSQARSFLAAANVVDPFTNHSYSLFGGGEVEDNKESSRVDIFDHSTQTWLKPGDYLSKPRKKLAAAAAQGIIAFGGGYTSGEKHLKSRGYQAQVDIWNSSSHVWTTAMLSQPRQYVVAGATDSQILFAGGFCSPCAGENTTTHRSNVVDIFDVRSNTWQSTKLSQRRSNLAVTCVGGRYVLFGGGTSEVPDPTLTNIKSNVVDIYDGLTQTWSVAKLSEARCCLGAGATENTAVFFGGGSGSIADIFEFH